MSCRNNQEKNILHNSLNEVLENELLKYQNEEQKKSHYDENMLESNEFLVFYIISALIQIVNYECFGIERYAEFPLNYEERNKIIHIRLMINKKELSSKLKLVMNLLLAILKYNSYDNLIITKFKEIIDTIKSNAPTEMIPIQGISLTSVYNVMDQIFEDKQISKLTYSNSYTFFGGGSFTEDFDKIIRSMEDFLGNIASEVNSNSLIKLETMILYLNQIFIESLQPYLLFITAHKFYKINVAIIEGKFNICKPKTQKILATELSEKI